LYIQDYFFSLFCPLSYIFKSETKILGKDPVAATQNFLNAEKWKIP